MPLRHEQTQNGIASCYAVFVMSDEFCLVHERTAFSNLCRLRENLLLMMQACMRKISV
jgi:hypothetical protein